MSKYLTLCAKVHREQRPFGGARMRRVFDRMVELAACDLLDEVTPIFRQMAENTTRESDDRSVAASISSGQRKLRIFDSEANIQLHITDNGSEVQVWVDPPFYASEDMELLIEVIDSSQEEALTLKDKLDRCVA